MPRSVARATLRRMWTASSPHGPDEQFLRRMSAPDNEVPVALPVNVVLARTDDVAVALLRLEVYSTGLEFCLAARVRADAALRNPLAELMWGRPRAHGRFLLGVEFADGRRASSLAQRGGHQEVVLGPRGASGGRLRLDQCWWLAPLPPEGPMRFVVRSDELGIEETSVELDGADVRAAAAGVVELWPWAPGPSPDHREPPPPPLPPDSWFAE